MARQTDRHRRTPYERGLNVVQCPERSPETEKLCLRLAQAGSPGWAHAGGRPARIAGSLRRTEYQRPPSPATPGRRTAILESTAHSDRARSAGRRAAQTDARAARRTDTRACNRAAWRRPVFHATVPAQANRTRD